MTKPAFKRMSVFIRVAWPGKTENWPSDAMKVWFDALRPYHDDEVSQGIKALLRDGKRDQQWPPTLAEIITRADQAGRFLRSQGWRPQ